MTRLYFSPLACSMVPRVVANELGVTLEYQQIEVFAKTLTEDGTPYAAITPLELVPVLELEDGERLTEVSAIVQWLSDRRPERGLLPALGTIERYRTLSWMSYVASEMHKRILWVVGNRDTPREAKRHARSLIGPTLDFVDHRLRGREWLAHDHFTLADAYLAWPLSLAPFLGIELGDRAALCDYAARISRRPSVETALAVELPLLAEAMARQASFLGRQGPSS